MDQPAVELRSVTKTLGETEVLSDLDLTVQKGEFVSLLGPSGVGKSTILNVVAGFLPVEAGHVLLMGNDMTYVPPHKRDLGFIFQEYALFPHMTVAGNVRFPLDMRKIKRAEAEKQVDAALDVVGLAHAKDRRPDDLSGGQRQRVAIARAMVFRPQVLLMDEPLSSLDRQLRDEMTIETRRLQRELGATVIYVTHDQTEALSLSDRVGIVRDGRIEQISTPREVHDRPNSVYVARLCGPLNLESEATIHFNGSSELCRIEIAGTTISSPVPRDPDKASALGVRPYLTRLQKEPAGDDMNSVAGIVTGISMVGNGVRYDVDIGGSSTWQSLTGHRFEGIEVGQAVNVVWAPSDSLALAE